MARFRRSGSGVATPFRDKAELTRALSELKISPGNDQAVTHEIYLRLGAIIDKWLAEQGQVEVSPVAKKLIWIARNLGKVSQHMSGLETGFRTSFEIALASQVQKYLALDPTVGSSDRGHEIIYAFQQEAARISRRYSLLGPDFHRQDRTSFAWRTHSITSSARASSVGGISRPSVPLSGASIVSLPACLSLRA
jgi:hypothetical protein